MLEGANFVQRKGFWSGPGTVLLIAVLYFGVRHCGGTVATRYVIVQIPHNGTAWIDGEELERKVRGGPKSERRYSAQLAPGEYDLRVRRGRYELTETVHVSATHEVRPPRWHVLQDEDGLWLEVDVVPQGHARLTGS